jgi:hypothetical protein
MPVRCRRQSGRRVFGCCWLPWWSPCSFQHPTSASLATKTRRYCLKNGNTGSQPYTPAPLQAHHYAIHEIHETADTLLATLGQPIFEPLTNAPTAKGEAELFYCKGSGADGVGEYTTEGFVVLKGSNGRIENVASIQGTSNVQIRASLVKDGVMAPHDGLYIFTRNHLFPSPSQAAMALMGRSANGCG